METLDCIALRRSVRKYKAKEVEWDKVGQVLLAGRDAPSSGNIQNWRFIIVTEEGLRKSVAEVCSEQYWMSQAPIHIVICAEPEKANMHFGIRGERLYTIQNCAAVIENMLLAATDIGLGSCWVGAFDEEQLARTLNIPDNVRAQAVITLGYAAEKPEGPSWKHEIYTIAFLNSYGGRMKNFDHVMGYHSEKVRRLIGHADKAQKTAAHHLRDLVKQGKEKVKEFHKQVKQSRKK